MITGENDNSKSIDFDNIEKALQSIKDTAIEKRIKEISAKRRMLRWAE